MLKQRIDQARRAAAASVKNKSTTLFDWCLRWELRGEEYPLPDYWQAPPWLAKVELEEVNLDLLLNSAHARSAAQHMGWRWVHRRFYRVMRHIAVAVLANMIGFTFDYDSARKLVSRLPDDMRGVEKWRDMLVKFLAHIPICEAQCDITWDPECDGEYHDSEDDDSNGEDE
jgi:hypothetical protein